MYRKDRAITFVEPGNASDVGFEKEATFKLVAAEEARHQDRGVERLLSYIEAKTGEKRFAKRADINPAELKDLLPDICFFVPIYDENNNIIDIQVKLQGTKAASFYGEFTGKSVHSHPSSEVGTRIAASVKAVAERRCSIFVESSTLSRKKDHLRAKALYVPMAEDGENIDRLLVYVRVVPKLFTNLGD